MIHYGNARYDRKAHACGEENKNDSTVNISYVTCRSCLEVLINKNGIVFETRKRAGARLDELLDGEKLNFQYFLNLKNKKVYKALRIVKMKDPTTRKWVEAIEYSPENNKFAIYVREKEDFKRKFCGLKG